MFHKIKNVSPLPEHRLSVQFSEGITKIYDVKPLFGQCPAFNTFLSVGCFFRVSVDSEFGSV